MKSCFSLSTKLSLSQSTSSLIFYSSDSLPHPAQGWWANGCLICHCWLESKHDIHIPSALVSFISHRIAPFLNSDSSGTLVESDTGFCTELNYLSATHLQISFSTNLSHPAIDDKYPGGLTKDPQRFQSKRGSNKAFPLRSSGSKLRCLLKGRGLIRRAVRGWQCKNTKWAQGQLAVLLQAGSCRYSRHGHSHPFVRPATGESFLRAPRKRGNTALRAGLPGTQKPFPTDGHAPLTPWASVNSLQTRLGNGAGPSGAASPARSPRGLLPLPGAPVALRRGAGLAVDVY